MMIRMNDVVVENDILVAEMQIHAKMTFSREFINTHPSNGLGALNACRKAANP